jgi:hypothetical protein
MSRFDFFAILSAIYFAPNLSPEIANACGFVALIVSVCASWIDRQTS